MIHNIGNDSFFLCVVRCCSPRQRCNLIDLVASTEARHYIVIESTVSIPPYVNTMNTDSTDAKNESCCLICKVPDEKGQQLISGCFSCDGTSGLVHLHCLVQNAQRKTKGDAESFGIERVDLRKIW